MKVRIKRKYPANQRSRGEREGGDIENSFPTDD
jgi:hypothetical protein